MLPWSSVVPFRTRGPRFNLTFWIFVFSPGDHVVGENRESAEVGCHRTQIEIKLTLGGVALGNDMLN